MSSPSRRLLAILRAPEAATEPVREELLEAARRHRLEPLVLHRLLPARPELLPARLRAEGPRELEALRLRALDLLGETVRLAAELTRAGIPAFPLKGPALALALWGDPALRTSRDVDLLVPAADAQRAAGVVERHGYRREPLSDGVARQIHLVDDGRGLVVDLHWNVTGAEMPFPLDVASLWPDRRLLSTPCGELALPSAPWLALVSTLYLLKEYPRVELVYLTDLWRLLASGPPETLEAACELARRTGTRRLLAAALELGRLLLDGPPPPANLAPRRWLDRTSARLLEVLDAPEHASKIKYWHRIREVVAHVGFRERAADRVRTVSALVPLLLRPDGEDHRLAPGRPWRARLARLPTALRALTTAVADRRPFPAGAWPPPGEDVTFHPLDEAGLLLDTRRQEIVALTPAGAFLWCALAERMPRPEVACQLARARGCSRAAAEAEIETWLADLYRRDLLAPRRSAAPSPAAPVAPPPERLVEPVPAGRARLRLRLLDTVVDLGLPDRALARQVGAALGHLRSAARADVRVELVRGPDGFALVAEGSVLERCADPAAAVPMVKGGLATLAVNRTRFGLFVHAAMLRAGDAALLLPASPGSGKTCLAAGLARAGLAYHTDEITLLEPDGLAARGLPVALTVKRGAWSILRPLYPTLERLATHERVDGQIVRYLPPPVTPGDPALDRAWPVRWLVLPRFEAGAETRLEPVARVDALRALFDECLALRLPLTPATVDRLTAWIGRIDCRRLVFGDLAEAVSRLAHLTAEPARGPVAAAA